MASSIRWCGKKRKADPMPILDDEDGDGAGLPLPLLFPKLMGSSSVYTQANHLYFNDDITYESAFTLNKELRSMEQKLRLVAVAQGIEPQPIFLHVTTDGGSIHAAFSVVDCILGLGVPVHTIAEGFVASAGTLITLAGEKRYITPNAYMLIHELRSGMWGKMSAIEEEYNNLKKIMTHIIDFYHQRTRMSKKDLSKLLVKDVIWNASETMAHGLTHEIGH